MRQIIFDMDGVITSEDGYWRAAECALLELAARLGHPGAQADVQDVRLPWRLDPELPLIAQVKALLINTNWDLCHLAAIALIWKLCEYSAANEGRLLQIDWSADSTAATSLDWPPSFSPRLHSLIAEILAHAGENTGFTLLEELAKMTGPAAPLFVRRGPVWEWLFRHFQRWFNGDATATPRRPGIIDDERLLLAPARIAQTLQTLRAAGWSLGIATGRTRDELLPTLRRFDLLRYFAPEAVVTHDEVAQAEAELAAVGVQAHLSKPHPFPFLRALFPQTPATELWRQELLPDFKDVVIVGDTVADITAAVTLGARAVAVLTGPGGAGAGERLAQAGATLLLRDVTELPAALARAAGPPAPNEWLSALPLPKPMAGPHRSPAGELFLHLGEAWYPPAPSVVQTLCGLGEAGRLQRYPDSFVQELREELARYCGHGVSAENILVGNGSDGLIDLLVTCYASPERPVAAPAPTFFVYGHAAALRRAPLYTGGRRTQEEGFQFDPEQFLRELPADTGLIFLASPNNPTGDFLPLQTVRQIAQSTQALVVVDECYFEFAGETALSLLAEHPNLAILRSLSKSFALAGLRAGYIVAHPEVIAALSRVDQTFSVNVAAQSCAVAALRTLEYYLPLFVRTVELRAEWSAMLTAAGLRVFPSRANILLVDYSSRLSGDVSLAEKLRAHGIHVADFHARPGIKSAVRVTIDELPALHRFQTAFAELLQPLAAGPKAL